MVQYFDGVFVARFCSKPARITETSNAETRYKVNWLTLRSPAPLHPFRPMGLRSLRSKGHWRARFSARVCVIFQIYFWSHRKIQDFYIASNQNQTRTFLLVFSIFLLDFTSVFCFYIFNFYCFDLSKPIIKDLQRHTTTYIEKSIHIYWTNTEQHQYCNRIKMTTLREL